MKTKYPKGAEWRKWDLHVHTPYSICQKFGADNDDTWGKYISDLEDLPSEFAVIGINDYLFLDGYKKLILEQDKNGKLQNLTLFPVVEFRIEKFAGVEFGSLKRINLHVIFSNELSVETIQSQFLNTLEQSYTLTTGEKWTRAITQDSVAELGASIKATVPKDKLSGYGSDLTEGFNNLNVKEDQIFAALEKDCFKDKYLIAIGKTEWAELQWTDASIATKKSIINSADIVFTSAESVDAFLKSKAQLTSQAVNDLLLDCSDAHDFSDSEDKDRIGKCYTWLKADPTFDGLKQVIIEPEERVFIGDKPPLLERVSNNRTKYIKELSITQVEGYDDRHGVWFKNVSIPLNSELVAIIGNKGSGKSAIADILALCSNYIPNDDFSFLHSRKFKENKLASNFKATLVWESGSPSSANLDDTPKETDLRGVKYLPQGQFERLTNEISTVEEFQQEIESVVFSHIPEAERLGSTSFQGLIAIKTASTEAQLDTHKRDVRRKNREIIDLERKATPTYRAEIESKIRRKNEELVALIEPPDVLDPNQDSVKKKLHEVVNAKIIILKTSIKKISIAFAEARKNKKEALESLQTLKTIRADVLQKKTDITRFIADKRLQLEQFDLDVTKLISVHTDFTELDELIQSKERELQKFKQQLGEADINGEKDFGVQLKEKEAELETEQAKLDGEQQQYQKHLIDKENWQKNRARITGAPDRPDTLKYYERELVYLESQLNAILEAKYKERRKLTCQIFGIKRQIIGVYKDARDKLQILIKKHQETLTSYRIDIDASLVKKTEFHSKFLGAINQGKKGTFRSADEGERQFLNLETDINFDEQDSVLSLLDSLVDALRFDKRRGKDNLQRDVADQVKDIPSLYDYLFSLEFLENNYQLKQGDKGLEQLSPGERGALLLVFYLLLDDSDIPLIIDQPEDNLDNQSVATVLVPFIREAKKRRQIILVTHNPNLAVVADAEQVIYVDLDKENKYTFSTISGSIEDKEVNQKIVDVLEGAMPAFNIRKRKYYDQ